MRRLALLAVLAGALGAAGCTGYPTGSDSSASSSAFGYPPQAWIDFGMSRARGFWNDHRNPIASIHTCALNSTVYSQDLDQYSPSYAGGSTGCGNESDHGGPGRIALDNDRDWTRNAVCVVITHEMGHNDGLRHWGQPQDGDDTQFEVMKAPPPIGAAYCPS